MAHDGAGRAHLILGIAAPGGGGGGGDDGAPPEEHGSMHPDEQEQHGSLSLQHMFEAMQKGDFTTAFHAFRAAAACAEPDGDEYEHGEGEEAEEPEGEE